MGKLLRILQTDDDEGLRPMISPPSADDVGLRGLGAMPAVISSPDGSKVASASGGLVPRIAAPVSTLPPAEYAPVQAGSVTDMPSDSTGNKIGPPASRLDSANAKLTGDMSQHPGVNNFAEHHHVLGTIAKIGDVLGSILAPNIAVNVPGSTLNFRQKIGQDQQEVGAATEQQKEQADTQESQARAQAITNPPVKPPTNEFELWHQQHPQGTVEDYNKLKEGDWEIVPNLEGPNHEPVLREKASGLMKVGTLPAGVAAKQDVTDPFKLWQKHHPTGTFDDYQKANGAGKRSAHINYDGGIPVSVTGEDNSVFDVNDPNLPSQYKALVDSANRAHAQRIREERDNKPEPGSLQLQEDATGHPILFNSKTGVTQPAPDGMQPKGTFAKTVKPVEDAQQYAQTYLASPMHTGSGDEALMEKFFELAKPSTGFRMSQPQQQMLKDSQSWMGSVEAKGHHALTGTWFSDDQRKQIVDTMNALAQSKRASAGAPSGQPPAAPQAGGSDWFSKHGGKAMQ
ncbi:MAG: hypothetical protein H0X25_12225 [Acidobacteriales bacterium]|nr:hypothetical protein [Terriglobales bacterium]